MTLVTAALDRVAPRVGVKKPTSWVAATDEVLTDLRDIYLPEVVEDLLRRVDWDQPTGKTVTITGTGAETYSLPSDFYRMSRDKFAVYEKTTVRRIGKPVGTLGEWVHLKEIGTSGSERFYRVHGREGDYSIDFYPLPTSGDTISISYVSDVWIVDSEANESNVFDADTDNLLMPRRLIETGLVATYRERKGLDFEIQKQEYEVILAQHANENTRVINLGPRQGIAPFDIPVPDYIPAS